DDAFAALVRLVDQRQILAVGWAAELRRGAALALGESGRSAAATTLREHLDARDAKLRAVCKSALAALEGGSQSLRLDDEDDWCTPARTGEPADADARFGVEADDA